jgi:hypothetical protein
VNDSKERYHNDLCESLDNAMGSKNYWCFIKKLLGKTIVSGIPALRDNNGMSFTDYEKASTFLNQINFRHTHDESIVSNVNLGGILPSVLNVRTRNILNSIDVSRAKVNKILKDLNPSKSGGCDGITGKMLNIVINTIDAPRCHLFERILTSGEFPDIWKIETIVPIF